MPKQSSSEMMSAVVVCDSRLPSSNLAYTLANALDSIAEHVVLVDLNSEDTQSIRRAGSLPLLPLSQVPGVVDWPTDCVFNTVSNDERAIELCRRLQQQQDSTWIERHDAAPNDGSNYHWRLTQGNDEGSVIAQPRWSRWQQGGPLNTYFIDALRQALAALPSMQRQAPTVPSVTNSEPKQRDVVLFWKQNDSGLYGRRSDQVAAYFARRADVRQVLVVDAPIKLENLKKRRAIDDFDQNAFIYKGTILSAFRQNDRGKIYHRVFCYNPANEGSSDYLAYLERLFAEQGIAVEHAIFWLYPKLEWGQSLLEHFTPYRRVVDVVDDHRAWPNISDEKREQLTEHYRAMLTGADKVLTNCLPVKLSMFQFHKDIAMVPNGCAVDEPSSEPTHLDAYQALCKHDGPVLGFVGNLEAKIDRELLEKLSEAVPEALIVLVGSTHANPDIRALDELPNVLMTGVVPYPYVSAFVKRFTVGLVPHKRIELTENMNPLKVFVYLSNDVPVVATDVPNIAKFDYVWQTDSHAQFIDAVVRLVGDDAPTLDAKKFAEFKRRNSWDMRLAVVVDSLLS